METFMPYVGILLQWARSRPKYSEEAYAASLILVSAFLYTWATPGFAALGWRADVAGWWTMLLAVAGTTQLTSTVSNIASKRFDAHWAPVTDLDEPSVVTHSATVTTKTSDGKTGSSTTLTILLVVSGLLSGIVLAHTASADAVYSAYVGGGGAWLDGPASAFPADVEASGRLAASLSPHISAVGGLDYGFTHSYARYHGGARVTTMDVMNPDFNTFLGIEYRGGSKPEVGPSEWAPEAGFGWRAFKSNWPRLLLTGDAGYGLTSKRVLVSLGIRYAFEGIKF